MDQETFGKLFISHIMPELEYASQARSLYLKKQKPNQEDLEEGIKDGIRVMNLSHRDRLKAANLPTLEERGVNGGLITTFKIFQHVNDIEM